MLNLDNNVEEVVEQTTPPVTEKSSELSEEQVFHILK